MMAAQRSGHEKICERNLEGIVAKRKNSLYRDSTRWLKIRNPKYSQKEGRKELFESRRPTREPKPE
jgi:ATP-dependent DNA ligase